MIATQSLPAQNSKTSLLCSLKVLHPLRNYFIHAKTSCNVGVRVWSACTSVFPAYSDKKTS